LKSEAAATATAGAAQQASEAAGIRHECQNSLKVCHLTGWLATCDCEETEGWWRRGRA